MFRIINPRTRENSMSMEHKISNTVFESQKQNMIQTNGRLKVLIKNEADTFEHCADIIEVITRYISMQSKEFYVFLKEQYACDLSAIKRIVYFENDLNEMRVHLLSFPEAPFPKMPTHKKAILHRNIQQFFTDVDIRLELEQKFFFPLFFNSETLIAK